MKRAKQIKRTPRVLSAYQNAACAFVEQLTQVKLMPWQRNLVETFAYAAGKRVVFMPARRNGMSSVRKMCAALRAVNVENKL